MILTFSVKADDIVRTDSNGCLAAKSKNVVSCAFAFDEAWDDYPIRHLFCINPAIEGHLETPALDASGSAVLSETALSIPARLRIGAYGIKADGDRITTKLATVHVDAGAYGYPENVPPPPQSIYEQLMKAIEDAIVLADSAANHADNLDLLIGDLSGLTTDDKATLVGAIDEVDAHSDELDERVTDLEESDFLQDGRLTALESEQVEQDARLDALEGEAETQGIRLTTTEDDIAGLKQAAASRLSIDVDSKTRAARFYAQLPQSFTLPDGDSLQLRLELLDIQPHGGRHGEADTHKDMRRRFRHPDDGLNPPATWSNISRKRGQYTPRTEGQEDLPPDMLFARTEWEVALPDDETKKGWLTFIGETDIESIFPLDTQILDALTRQPKKSKTGACFISRKGVVMHSGITMIYGWQEEPTSDEIGWIGKTSGRRQDFRFMLGILTGTAYIPLAVSETVTARIRGSREGDLSAYRLTVK
jgi:hypothetical protein